MNSETPSPCVKIAKNRDEFTSSLFSTGGTFDGYIERVLKGGIKLFVLGETYVLNRGGVFCLATKQPDGRTWYSYGGHLNEYSLCQLSDLAGVVRSLAAQRQSIAA